MDGGSGGLKPSPPAYEGLLGPFRVLAGGKDLEAGGDALLEQACLAFGAAEGAVLLAEEAFAPGPSWGTPGPDGRLGGRRGDRELVADAVAAGADDYFTKPFSPLALLNMVERVRQAQSRAG